MAMQEVLRIRSVMTSDIGVKLGVFLARIFAPEPSPFALLTRLHNRALVASGQVA